MTEHKAFTFQRAYCSWIKVNASPVVELWPVDQWNYIRMKFIKQLLSKVQLWSEALRGYLFCSVINSYNFLQSCYFVNFLIIRSEWLCAPAETEFHQYDTYRVSEKQTKKELPSIASCRKRLEKTSARRTCLHSFLFLFFSFVYFSHKMHLQPTSNLHSLSLSLASSCTSPPPNNHTNTGIHTQIFQ